MLFILPAFNHHVINVDLHRVPDLIFEHLGCHSLVHGSCILHPKRHHNLLIISPRRYEGGLLLILECQGDQIISLESVQETHSRVSVHCVHQLINFRYWERIPWVGTPFKKTLHFPFSLVYHYYSHLGENTSLPVCFNFSTSSFTASMYGFADFLGFYYLVARRDLHSTYV